MVRALGAAALWRHIRWGELRTFSTTIDSPGVRTNWAENVAFRHQRFETPETAHDLTELVRKASSIRVLGSGHSFTPICNQQSGTLVSLAYMRNILDFDVDNMTITVEGGTTYGDIVKFLVPRGAALKNLPSLPHVTVAGALATGTHGSGLMKDKEGAISKHVAAIEFIGANGIPMRYKRGDINFEHVVVHLGALGPVASVTLDITHDYDVTQYVYGQVPMNSVIDNFEELAHSCDSFSASFNFGYDTVDSLWMRHFHECDENPPSPKFGSHLYESPMLKDSLMFFESGRPVKTTHTGRWFASLQFFMEDHDGVPVETNMPHLTIQSEFEVDLACSSEALREVAKVAKNWEGWSDRVEWEDDGVTARTPLVLSNETRVVPRDGFAMSPFGDGDKVSIHITFGPYPERVKHLVREMETALRPFNPRPHWGKFYTLGANQVHESFDRTRIRDFNDVRLAHDPEGKFMNDFIREQVLGLEMPS